MENIAKFLFEVGMLKKTPRTGLQFLGSGEESVAEHVFRVAIIGYTLARLHSDVDELKILKMCFFHDLPEARTGDLNYVNKKYVIVDEKKAVQDFAETIPFGTDIQEMIEEFNRAETMEARLANDADQLELILMLKEHKDLGNKYAEEWISFALKRLRTEAAQNLARSILETDSTAWWFAEKNDWWINGGNPRLK